MDWRVYTSHHTRHFSKRHRLPGDCFSPLIEDHAPKYISTLTPATPRYVGTGQNGEVENSYFPLSLQTHHSSKIPEALEQFSIVFFCALNKKCAHNKNW